MQQKIVQLIKNKNKKLSKKLFEILNKVIIKDNKQIKTSNNQLKTYKYFKYKFLYKIKNFIQHIKISKIINNIRIIWLII